MATPGKLAKKEKIRLTPAKTSFTSPFTPQWSTIPQDDMKFILKTLTEKLKTTGLEKKEVKVFRPWRKKKKVQEPPPPTEVQEKIQDLPTEGSPQNGWTDVSARRQLAIGINEVTKALERNQLKLVLVCKSVKPKHMVSHLIPLCATRGVPACQVPRLSESVAEPLGLKSVLALGIRRSENQEEEMFTDVVEAIRPKVPSLNVPWLKDVTHKNVGTSEEEVIGQKRKRENDLEIDSSCSLLPLKVKKIVANPEKKKKKKVK